MTERESDKARQSVTHDLKCWVGFFQDVLDGRKPFEIRQNDRNYRVGDSLLLREWSPDDKVYTGRRIECEVTYITSWEQKPDHVVMGIATPRPSLAAPEHPCAIECQRREHKGYLRCTDANQCDYGAKQMKLNDVLENLYGSEINCGIQSFWDGHWTAWLGDDMNGKVVEETALKFDEIAPWLDEQARKHYPKSVYAGTD